LSRRAANGSRGFTLVEALVALSLVASAGLVASVAGAAMLALERAAHGEAAGLAVAGEKMEELVALPPAERRNGTDDVVLDGVAVTRVWRVVAGDPAYGVTRLEVTARWERPDLTLLTLVGVVPGRSGA
jgi:hypothetical protein